MLFLNDTLQHTHLTNQKFRNYMRGGSQTRLHVTRGEGGRVKPDTMLHEGREGELNQTPCYMREGRES